MKKSIFLIITTFLLIACNSNLEKIHYNETDAQPAILQDIENSYILEAQQSDQIAIVFEWSLPRLNYPAAVTTDLQMDI